MKPCQVLCKFNISIIVLLLVMFGASSTALSQAQKAVITLYVNTAQITNNNLSANCNFGQPSNISNEEYTISLSVGDSVTWVGVSSNAPDKDVVNITSINYRGGTNVFDKNVLAGNGESPESVNGKVIKPTAGNNCKYSVSFTVYNNGVKRNGTFIIDPKLEVH